MIEAQELVQIYDNIKNKPDFINECLKREKNDREYYDYLWEIIDATYDYFVDNDDRIQEIKE